MVLIVIFAETAATKMIPLWIMLGVSALTAERLLQTKKQRYAQNVSRDVSRRQKSGLRKQERLGVVTAVARAAAYLASQISSDDSTEDDTDGVSLKKD